MSGVAGALRRNVFPDEGGTSVHCTDPSVRAVYDALGHRFAIECDDDQLRTHLRTVLRSLEGSFDEAPQLEYRITSTSGGYELAGPEGTQPCAGRWQVVGHLLAAINRTGIASAGERNLVLHAAVAAKGPVVLVLPGRSESGKSTLVTELIKRGWDYLTDEAAVLDPLSLTITAYPKPIFVDHGAWSLFPELAPTDADTTGYQWQVDPDAVRAGCVRAAAGPPTALVFPTYRPKATNALVAMKRSDAVVAVAENAFNLQAMGRSGFEAATRLVAGLTPHRLVSSDLDTACDLLEQLTSGTDPVTEELS